MRKLNDFDSNIIGGDILFPVATFNDNSVFAAGEDVLPSVDVAALSLARVVEQGYHTPNFTTDPAPQVDVSNADTPNEKNLGCCACAVCSPEFDGVSFNAGSKDGGITESGTGNNWAVTAATGDQYKDGIFIGTNWTDATLDYSFAVTAAAYNYTAYDSVNLTGTGNTELPANFSPISAMMETAAHFALSATEGNANAASFSLEGFTNVGINFLGNTDAGNGHIRFGNADGSVLGTARVADFPGSQFASLNSPDVEDDGDVWYGTGQGGVLLTPEAGNYGWTTNLHEIGHALGLKHSQDAGYSYGAVPADMDAMEFTIMSYRSYIGGPSSGGYTNEQWGYAQTFMMLDIAALQYMYGADFTANSGDTVYSWDETNGNTLIDGNVAIDPGANRIFATIWDGDGEDTYDLSNYTTDLNIDLAPGGYSVFDAVQLANLGGSNFASGNIYNALQFNGDDRSLIENAIGGTGDDTIAGNAADNDLDAGAGNDTVSYASDTAGVNVNLNTGTGTGADAGNDTLTDFENAIGGSGDDVLVGTNDVNRLDGGEGDDLINGAGGNDVLFGNYGLDVINGGGGDDLIYGANNESTGAPSISFGTGNITRAPGAGNNGFGTAIDVTNEFSLAADPDIANATIIPHVSIDATGDAAPSIHYYQITLDNIGTILTVDVDYGSGSGVSIDSWVEIYDAGFNRVAFGDDSSTSEGAGGSSSTLDSFVTHTTAVSGVFYIAVGEFNNLSPIDANGTYELQISVQESVVIADTAKDILSGGGGNDEIYGEDGNDLLYGDAGDDTLDGGNGIDILNGGLGEDVLIGGDGNDQLRGRGQDDILFGDAGEDFLDGGGGNDMLNGGDEADTLLGGNGMDSLLGGAGDDLLDGGNQNDILDGDAGNDTLLGGDGRDSLSGGDGDDTLDAGTGRDRLSGDAGADIFVFSDNQDIGVITDFQDGIDRIDLSGHSVYADFTDVLASAATFGNGVIIYAGANDVIAIQNFTLADLDASDFIF